MVWLSCYGFPLNLWNSDTFRRIGRVWGKVVNFDGDIGEPTSFSCGRIRITTSVMELINSSINLDCKGRIYPIRLCEEQIVKEVKANCKCNTQDGDEDFVSSNIHGEMQTREESRRDDDKDNNEEVAKRKLIDQRKDKGEMEVEGSWEVLLEVEETKDCLGKSTKEDTCVEDSMMKVDSIHMQVCNYDAQKVDGQIITPGFIRSISRSQRDRPGICLEVKLGPSHFKTQLNGLGLCNQNVQGTTQVNENRSSGPSMVGFKTHKTDTISISNYESVNNQKKGKRKGNKDEGIENRC